MKNYKRQINALIACIIFLYGIALIWVVFSKQSLQVGAIQISYSNLDDETLERAAMKAIDKVRSHSALAAHMGSPKIIIASSQAEYGLIAAEFPWRTMSFGKFYGFLNTIVISPWRTLSDETLFNGENYRTFSDVMAHELVHQSIKNKIGFLAERTLPPWIAEGIAEHVTTSGSYDAQKGLIEFCSGKMNDIPAFQYFTYRLNVFVQLEYENLTIDEFLAQTVPFDQRLETTRNIVCQSQELKDKFLSRNQRADSA